MITVPLYYFYVILNKLTFVACQEIFRPILTYFGQSGFSHVFEKPSFPALLTMAAEDLTLQTGLKDLPVTGVWKPNGHQEQPAQYFRFSFWSVWHPRRKA
jgi:hypothetical protein